jgi:competence protein ComFB
MVVTNVVEVLVKDTLQSAYLSKHRLVCECEQCQNDIMAIALNHLPSHYVSTALGNVYVKVQYLDAQLQSDVVKEVELASEIVARNPRHALD